MEVRSIESVIRALNDAGVRYLIAGGMAVVAHGYVRFTADLDLILELSETNLRPALTALTNLGYRPTAPVPLEAFADGPTRSEWIQSKGLTVLSLRPKDQIDIEYLEKIREERTNGGKR